MTHPSEGTLRRLLDEPAAVSDADRAHAVTCPRCARVLDGARRDRDLVTAVLGGSGLLADGSGSTGGQDDVDRAWAQLRGRLGQPEPAARPAATVTVLERPRGTRIRSLGRRAARRPVAIALSAGLAVLGCTAAAAAADWLPVFRTEHVAPVTVSAQDLTDLGELWKLSSLARYGELSQPQTAEPEEVADAATAQARTGLAVLQPGRLPQGVQGSPQYQVIPQQTVGFTFSAAKAQQAARQAGAALPPVPAGLDGTRLQIRGGPAVLLTWGQKSGIAALVVARAKAPVALTQGAPLPVVRDYLLSLPGISPALAAQLKAVTGDGTTLPVPVPASLATSSQVDVGGTAATLVQLRNGAAAAVLWVRDGVLTGVGGPLSADEVLDVARGLRTA